MTSKTFVEKQKVNCKTLDQSLQGRLGLVFDTTSADASKIANIERC